MRQAYLLELNDGDVGCDLPEYLILHVELDELLGLLLEDSSDDVGAHVRVLLEHGARHAQPLVLLKQLRFV
uniref:Uncharacterized protein n=1 Tax=Acrobeloides nanus TaxID=290746 RepID=A0A914CBH7_9BILA